MRQNNCEIAARFHSFVRSCRILNNCGSQSSHSARALSHPFCWQSTDSKCISRLCTDKLLRATQSNFEYIWFDTLWKPYISLCEKGKQYRAQQLGYSSRQRCSPSHDCGIWTASLPVSSLLPSWHWQTWISSIALGTFQSLHEIFQDICGDILCDMICIRRDQLVWPGKVHTNILLLIGLWLINFTNLK